MTIIDDYILPQLGPKAARQFREAQGKPCRLITDFIDPSVYAVPLGKAHTDGLYVPVSMTKHTPGRNHRLAQDIFGAGELDESGLPIRPDFGGDPYTVLTYFANPLRISDPFYDQGREAWERPSERVVYGPWTVFTFEFDDPSVAFLKQQLSWLRSPTGKPSGSPMGRLFDTLSQFPDFNGITVCWSGNKSLHIHVVFDPRLAVTTLNLPVSGARDGFKAHWHTLHETYVKPALGVTKDADVSMAQPEQYRRLPNGVRTLDKTNILGLPAGTDVPQTCLWERYRDRAAKGSDRLFFMPAPFMMSPATLGPSARKAPKISAAPLGDLTADQVAYCSTKLGALYSSWPRFHSLNYEGRKWVAKFLNDPTDQNPSSVMTEAHRSILVQGKAAGLNPRSLPLSLGAMISLWIKEQATANVPTEDEAEVLMLKARPTPTAGSVLEDRFQAKVTSTDAAKFETQRFFLKALKTEQYLWVRGPEGGGKSTGMMAVHPRIMKRLVTQGHSPLSLYVFGSYEQAEKKCAAFNAIQNQHGYKGVVIPSFTEAYRRAAAKLGLKMMSHADAAAKRHSSLWQAVKALQPGVMEEFRAFHGALWAQVGSHQPAFFSVHEVAHGWTGMTPTRRMWAPSFWDQEDQPDEDHSLKLQNETALGLCVHDEVKLSTVLELQRAEVVEWIDALAAKDWDTWNGKRKSLDKMLVAYQDHVAATGETKVSFDEARRLIGLSSIWDDVKAEDHGEYQTRVSDEFNIYRKALGRKWMVQPRHWWHCLAARVVVLTTEQLPTLVAKKADYRWAAYDLGAPGMKRDVIECHPAPGIRSDNLPNIVQDFRTKRGNGWAVVSNKVKGAVADSVTHASAKGDNSMIGRDVVQTACFMAVEEYERMEVLNGWLERDDACRLRHLDELNQTAGRNLGFRQRQGARHVLLMNRQLLGLLLEGEVLPQVLRYDLAIHLEASQRKSIREASPQKHPDKGGM